MRIIFRGTVRGMEIIIFNGAIKGIMIISFNKGYGVNYS